MGSVVVGGAVTGGVDALVSLCCNLLPLGVRRHAGYSVLGDVSKERHKCGAGVYDDGRRDKEQDGTANGSG